MRRAVAAGVGNMLTILAAIVMTLSPSSGQGWLQEFTATYSDKYPLKTVTFYASNGAQKCEVKYTVGTGLLTLSDGVTIAGNVQAGTGPIIRNAACVLDTPRSAVKVAAKEITMRLTLALEIRGPSSLWMAAVSAKETQAPVSKGTWTVPPVAVTISPISAEVLPCKSQKFVANVANAWNKAVTWTIVPATGRIEVVDGNTAVYYSPCTRP